MAYRDLYPSEEFVKGMRLPQKIMFASLDAYIEGKTPYKYHQYIFHRRCGKTTGMINWAIKTALRFENKQVVFCLPNSRQGRDIYWDVPKGIVHWLPTQKDKNGKYIYIESISTKTMVVKFKNGSIIKFISGENVDTTRGIEGDYIIFDEYSIFENDRMWQETVLPIVSVDPSKMAIFIYTPKGMNHAHLLWEEAKKKPNWFTLKMDVTQTEMFSKEQIKTEIRPDYAKEEMFRQEMMCDFLADNEMVLITQDIINDALTARDWGRKPRENKLVCAIDPSEGGDEAVIYVMQDYKVIDSHIFSASGKKLLPEVIAYKGIEFQRKYGFDRFFVDAIGSGQGVIVSLRNMGAKVFEFKSNAQKGLHLQNCYNLRAETYWSAMEYLQQQIIPIPSDSTLIKQLTLSKYSPFSANGKIIIEKKELIKKKLGSSTDRADAWLLGCWATRFYAKASNVIGGTVLDYIENDIKNRRRYRNLGMVL